MKQIKYKDWDDEINKKPLEDAIAKLLAAPPTYQATYKDWENVGMDRDIKAGYTYTSPTTGKEYRFGSEGLYKIFDMEAQAAYKNAQALRNAKGNNTDGTPMATYDQFFDARYFNYGSEYRRKPEADDAVKYGIAPINYDAEYVEHPTAPSTTPSATAPMTYEQWVSSGGGDNSYAGQRKNATYAQAEAARAEAERLAEIERKRAVVDADTLEKQQRATYGQMAEQMGAMGLSGSGYSDYINSGAYAAGMAARQNANAKAAEAKQNASYAEYMAKLEADKQYATEKELAEKEAEALKREDEAIARQEEANAKAEQQTKYSNFLNSIPEGATAEQIKSLAKLWGITDEAIVQNATDYVTSYSENSQAEKNWEEDYDNKIASGDYIGAAVSGVEVTNPTADENTKNIIKARDIAEALPAAISDSVVGENQLKAIQEYVSTNAFGDEGTKIIKEAYSKWALERINNFTVDNKQMSPSEARALLNEATNSGLLTESAKSEINNAFDKAYKTDKNIVDINSNTFTLSAFGNYSGTQENTSDATFLTKQTKYLNAIIDMANNGALEKHDVVCVNYGAAGKDGYYLYLGNGLFQKVDKAYAVRAKDAGKFKIPDGYNDDRGKITANKG